MTIEVLSKGNDIQHLKRRLMEMHIALTRHIDTFNATDAEKQICLDLIKDAFLDKIQKLETDFKDL